MSMRETGGAAMRLLRSVLLLGLLLVGVPATLIAIATARFGGGSPLHGLPSPGEWSDVQGALTERLPDSTIADIVIRLGLSVGWIAVLALAVTVAVEAVHMARHGGLAMPDVRGLGLIQRTARVLAGGPLDV